MITPDTIGVWLALLESFRPAFTAPSFCLLHRMLEGWLLCPGRRTVTRLCYFGDPQQLRSHDAYHRFLSVGAWSLAQVWLIWFSTVLSLVREDGTIPPTLVFDDTLYHRTGKRVVGAGYFRDALASTASKTVTAWGLNMLIVALLVKLPFLAEPVALPVWVQVHRKEDEQTLLEMARHVLHQLQDACPTQVFKVVADGFYAPLAGMDLPVTMQFVSRLRKNAKLYEQPAPRRHGQRGRPALKGKPLPSLLELARTIPPTAWQTVRVGDRQFQVHRKRNCLWWGCCRTRPISLVIARQVSKANSDLFLLCTDPSLSALTVLQIYLWRWSIEITIRDVKQHLGGQEPQCWQWDAPERAAALSFLLYGLAWIWYSKAGQPRRALPNCPWYPHKSQPSFHDALAAIRNAMWRHRINTMSDPQTQPEKNAAIIIECLSIAA